MAEISKQMKVNTADAGLPESSSLLLDFIRFAAAVLVFICHITNEEFHLGFPILQYLGDAAVAVFFVLSGLVIRYVTVTRRSNLQNYMVDRASRIYSVALPAMLFTLIVSAICYWMNPALFRSGWGSYFNSPLIRLVTNLTFVSQFWNHNIVAFLDGPFWSLGYECIYYVLYGFIFFLRGWKRIVSCLLVALAIGPQVMFLLPVWYLGVWAYDLYIWARGGAYARIALWIAGAWLLLGAIAMAVGHSAILSAPVSLYYRLAYAPNPLLLMGFLQKKASMFTITVGLFFTVILLLLLFLVDSIHISRDAAWTKIVRRVANGTFVIYLVHYPFLVLLFFMGILKARPLFGNVLLFFVMAVIMILVSPSTDTLKNYMRKRLQQAFKLKKASL